jgi:glutamate--cysteine ligase
MSVTHLNAVPHLTTALVGPLQTVESHFLRHQAEVEAWFRTQWLATPAPFYASVDLRNAGFKLAPVDTNLFPAGFNNLNPVFAPLSVQAVQTAVERILPAARRVLLIPENHTRNTFYLESVAALMDVIRKAGLEVRLGSLIPDLAEPREIELPSGATLRFEPLVRDGERVGVDGFFPCLILLNNDLSGGRPAILEGVEQTVVPPLDLGWSNRLKSGHFAHYREVAGEFASHMDLDPWLIDPMFRNCGHIDFMNGGGGDCVGENVQSLLDEIQKKYDEYGVDKAPFVFVKADAGTYGMGVMAVHSAEEVRSLNRKQRTRMSSAKEGQQVTQVILQEGIYTFETWGEPGAIAEPVVYTIDHMVVGGFYRVHTARGPNENLNSPGMRFEPLAFVEPCNTPDFCMAPDACTNRFYAYGVVARLALLAAARELAEMPRYEPCAEDTSQTFVL